MEGKVSLSPYAAPVAQMFTQSLRNLNASCLPDAFSRTTSMFREIQALMRLHQSEPALRYGRQYFREVSENGTDFGFSYGTGGIVAFSRILGDREILIAANTGETVFDGRILADRDLNVAGSRMDRAYPAGAAGAPVNIIDANINGSQGKIATVKVTLAPHEVCGPRLLGRRPRPVCVTKRQLEGG